MNKYDEPPIPVSLSPTTFVNKDYVEEGWEIAVVHYPLREDSDEDIILLAEGQIFQGQVESGDN